MMIANVPVVYFGDAISRRVPVAMIRGVTAAFFLALGVLALFWR